MPAMQVCDCDCDCDCVCVVGEGWPCEGEGEGPPGSGKAGHAGGVAGQAPSYQACRGGGWERGAVVQGGKRVTLWLWPQQTRCTEPLFAKAHVLPPPLPQANLACVWPLYWWTPPHGRAFTMSMCTLKARALGAKVSPALCMRMYCCTAHVRAQGQSAGRKGGHPHE